MLETLVTLLIKYIDRYNISTVLKASHLQLLSLNRDEALHRNRISYEDRNHDGDDNEMAEDETDCSSLGFLLAQQVTDDQKGC